ncbi:fungal-specific transcription factor domain-containing protein [Lactarius quietus]|nr:fungal-specific transcription factor domain-containing protein [Lactarius quietus]
MSWTAAMNHSSEDENLLSTTPLHHANSTKRRRVQNQRACDRCRQKKIRCDGTPSSSKCSHCSSSGTDCIFTESTKVRGPPKRLADSLETRLEKMEGMLSRLYPDGDFSQDMELDGWARGFQPDNTTAEEQSSIANSPSVDDSTSYPSPAPPPEAESNSEDSEADVKESTDDLLGSLRQLCLQPSPRRYFGKSSGIDLLRTAITIKSKSTNGESSGVEPEYMQRRNDFWNLHPWERGRYQSGRRHFDFPEPDLLADLIVLYFQVLAPMVPLLHRPTFKRAFDSGVHLRDEKFASLVLLVCATASKFSNDPRVLLENGHWHSAGWKWFSQVEPFSNTVLSGPDLYDLQVAALAVVYVHGTLPPQEGWIMVGVGLRLAQDVGAHRRRSPNARPTVEDELWKRAFWVLLMLDIWTSSALGRPCAMTEESHDVELPIECDDEYWEHPNPALAFKQPPGKPSKVSYFNYLIKINLLHSHALRTIYSLSKTTLITGRRAREKGWEEHTVADLDSALNSWFDSIPDHLRWDPQREDETFFIQSANLRSAYYFIQIAIHRPFIPSSRKGSSLSFAALAICASAARAYTHVADVLRKRYPLRTSPAIIFPAFASAVVLLLSLWGAKRTGTTLDPVKEMQDVRKCIMILETAETRWSIAGRLRDLLSDLSTAGNLEVPADSPASNKREREDSDDESQQSVAISPSPVQQPQRASPMMSSAYPEMSNMPADNFLRRPSMQISTAAPPPAAPMSSSALAPAMPSDMYHPPRGKENLLLPKPYQGSYIPLGGSSGLGSAVSVEPTTPPSSAPRPASMASYGSSSSRLPAAGFSSPSTISANDNATLPMRSSSSELSMGLGSSGLYDMSSTSASASTSATAPNSPPQSASYAAVSDFRHGAGGVFDMGGGGGMEFGAGYGVPVAYKEAMRRHFAPVLQDGQIGVDQDTMMMWSTMPSTYETQDWVTYMSNMLDLAHANVDPAVVPNDGLVGRL